MGVPPAWLYPILCASRQNLKWDPKHKKIPNDEILDNRMVDMVSVCIQEHRANQNKPEWVGKKGSAYRQCPLYVELYPANRKA